MQTNSYGLSALGMINALGNNNDEIRANLARSLAPGMRVSQQWFQERSVVAGEVLGDLPPVPHTMPEFNCRNNRLMLAALAQINDPINERIARFGRSRVGVVIGSSTSGILEGELAAKQLQEKNSLPEDYDYRQQEIGSPAIFVSRYFNLSGPSYTVSTACSSSAKVFASARNLLANDLCDAVIVGGSDSLCKLTLHGFRALESISDDHCNPFSVNRDGICIGEGSAIFIMEKTSAAINLLGVGESSDAHHMSAPDPEGHGAMRAMQSALDDAKLGADQICYANLHGTATKKNDAMESIAVNRVLGETIPCSSTKSLTGHTLGAAGATETGLCWLLINHRDPIPAQRWDGQYDDTLATINIVNQPLALPTNTTLTMMSNSFAFGGSNATVIIGQS